MSQDRAPIVVPRQQAGGGETAEHKVSQTVSRLSSSVLPYLKALSDGGGTLAAKQLGELHNLGIEKDDAGKIELSRLLQYMTSEKSNAIDKAEPLDQSYPISNYFISSSHNTYLTGHQLYGTASAEPYKNVLLRGCRCIEIDVWDGDERKPESDDERGDSKPRHRLSKSPSKGEKPKVADNGNVKPWTTASSTMRAEPKVVHGYTLTKEVAFRDVCEAIRDAAFVTSDLPVIVSLEVHASMEQQEIMVEVMEQAWKGMLAEAPKEEAQTLPTPADLKGKILVKVKAAPLEPPAALAKPELKRVRSDTSTSSSDEGDERTGTTKGKKKSKIIDALSALGIYTRSYHFKGLLSPEAKVPTHIFSLSEKRLEDVHEEDGVALFGHNKHFLMRTYPSGTRVSSSNLDPLAHWRKGVQIVALNWQRFDAGMMLNEGQFAGTGGWVLKPKGYRGVSKEGHREETVPQTPQVEYKTLDMTIEVLAGQDLPLPKEDSKQGRLHPYIKCELHTEKPRDATGKGKEAAAKNQDAKHKRRSKNGKTNEPDFGGEKMRFSGISIVEELSFVRFKIKDDNLGKDDLMAWACVRLDRLREGYRFIHLIDAKGVETSGVLLVNVTKQLS